MPGPEETRDSRHGRPAIDLDPAHVLQPSIGLVGQERIFITWKNGDGETLVKQKIAVQEGADVGNQLSELYFEFANDPNGFQAAVNLLRGAESHPKLCIETTAYKPLLNATARELLDLVDAEVYFVPPAKARDSKLGMLTGSALLSTATLPVERGDWALVSMDVIGLRQIDRPTGDKVLQAIAPLAQKHFGKDLRLNMRDGGDEFVMLVKMGEEEPHDSIKEKVEAFRADLVKVRNAVLAGLDGAVVKEAVITTLKTNAFRSDLQGWRDEVQQSEDADLSFKGFADYMVRKHPELADRINLNDWPKEVPKQEDRIEGLLSYLLGDGLHYQKIAAELANDHNPLLNVRASVVTFSGTLSPELMVKLKAQNNFEIDRQKNDPDPKVIVREQGFPTGGEQRDFAIRGNEREQLTAIFDNDSRFHDLREELYKLRNQPEKQDQVFSVACELARLTAQDAQYPDGCRISSGAHLLTGHIFHFKTSTTLHGIEMELQDSSVVNNWLSPRLFDQAYAACCRATQVVRIGRIDECTLRFKGGTAFQLGTAVMELNTEALAKSAFQTYHGAIWSDTERQARRLDVPARIARLASKILSRESGGEPITRQNFPRAKVTPIQALISPEVPLHDLESRIRKPAA